jgi:hypothetical protein
MDPISITGTLIAILQITSAVITICYDYRQGSKNASREVIQISDELSSLKDFLDALLRLAEKSESNDASDLSTFELLARPGGPLLSCQTELERLKSKLEPEKGWRKVRQSLVWPLQEGEMRRTLGSLERLKSTMSLALSTDQATLALAIRDDVEDLTQLFQRHSTDLERQDIHKWLAAQDPHANHVASRKKRQPQTGNWFLTGKVYEKWLTQSSSFLWLFGIPGSGKTVLCSTIIENLIRYCEQMPQTALAYFYFDFNDAGKSDVSSVIKSLITQFSGQSETTPLPLLELYQNHKNGTKTPDEEVLIVTLRSLVLTFHNVYIVFDALDESSDCEELLNFIRVLHGWELSRLHILATSRQLATIEETLMTMATSRICLQDSYMNKDIFLYISDKLENDKTLAKWPPEIRDQIKMKLLMEEDGMFQWVVCQLDMLKCCMSIAAIRQRMTALAGTLDETYDQILSSIDEMHQVEVMKTLQALTVTVYPLCLGELVEIIAVDLEATPPRFDKDSRLLDPRSILSMCSSLVTNSREMNSTTVGSFLGTKVIGLRLAHASVADYLSLPKTTRSSRFHFSRLDARLFLAQSCLVYLLNPEFAGGHDTELVTMRLNEYGFLPHAIRFWPMYLERLPGDPDDHLSPRTKELLKRFFDTSKMENGGNFAFWVGMLIPTSPLQHINNTQPLYYAASFGLTEVVKILLETEKDIDVNALGGRAISSPLHVAVYRNHIDVVKILLENGADPNLPNKEGESPLYWADANINEEMEELLTKHGARGGSL